MDDPSIRGKAVLVGGTSPRSVVTTASYEARVFGCRSAMPMGQALRLCPHAIIKRPRFSRYHELSDQMFAILGDYTPTVQSISLDEAFLDLTGTERLHGSGVEVARAIKRRVRDEIGLTISAGVAHNKFLAKLASDLNKPDGLMVITPENVDGILPPLSISKIWGIGPRTASRFNDLGIRTIGDLRKLGPDLLELRFGSEGLHYHRLAHGIDDREVVSDRQAKSVGQEQTFGENIADPETLRSVLLGQVEQVASRLRRNGLLASGVSLKIRDGEFRTITRARALSQPTDLTRELWDGAKATFDEWAATHFKPLRLLGVTAIRLGGSENQQLSLFDDAAAVKQKRVDAAADQIAAKFGRATLFRGSAVTRSELKRRAKGPANDATDAFD